jgi:hypothetical protein
MGHAVEGWEGDRSVDLALLAVAEALVLEFPDVPSSTVVKVVNECSESHPGSDLMFVQAAARARLRELRDTRPPGHDQETT